MTTDPVALPERVRARVVSLAADALGALPVEQVPPALRRVAAFTPARRARAAGGQLLAALSEQEFRERLAVQVRARRPELTRALEAGERTDESAALAYLLDDPRWQEIVDEAAADPSSAVPAPPNEAVLTSLRQRLEKRESDLARARTDLAAAQEELRTEKASVRHRIGEARSQGRESLAVAEAARRAAEEAAAAALAAAEQDRAELIALRARLAAAEADLLRARRQTRQGREAGTVRARLLLDTIVQAGQGLRQELGLPVVEGAPADQVTADLADPGADPGAGAGVGFRAPPGVTSRPLDDPARLRDLLALPAFHLIVDGYNVTRDSWGEQTLEEQRSRLLRALASWTARTGEITVVFDGANAVRRAPLVAPRGLRVVFSPQGVIADDVIRDFVAAEPPGRPVGVVTSDQEIVRAVTRRPGVYAIASRALVRLLG